MIKYGKIMICDRCGKTVFCEKIGETSADGGFSTYTNYDESLADGWGKIPSKKDVLISSNVCPDCYQDFLEDLDKYYKRLLTEDKPE
jgi:hypothetical protein